MTRWIDLPIPEHPVPPRYRGVWQRTLLQTPEGRDTTTRVHWLQTEGWHADLRVPAGIDPATPAGRAQLQGFCGITRISGGHDGQPEVCTWHRRWDIQPPRSTPDAGHMVFETPDRLIETGVHAQYLEVWERLPGSDGPFRALAQVDDRGDPTGVWRFEAGRYAQQLRGGSRSAADWPADLQPDETLAQVLQRHPALAPVLLDFELRLEAAGDAP